MSDLERTELRRKLCNCNKCSLLKKLAEAKLAAEQKKEA